MPVQDEPRRDVRRSRDRADDRPARDVGADRATPREVPDQDLGGTGVRREGHGRRGDQEGELREAQRGKRGSDGPVVDDPGQDDHEHDQEDPDQEGGAAEDVAARRSRLARCRGHRGMRDRRHGPVRRRHRTTIDPQREVAATSSVRDLRDTPRAGC